MSEERNELNELNTTQTNHEYGGSEIQVLEGLEAVRKRPGMYIGSTSESGLHHLVYEIVDNSIDEALAGYCTDITVTINPGNTITVTDNGRGIPVDIQPQTGRPALEVVFTILHAGGKFGGGGYKVSGGLHGVGASVVNALSEWLEVQVHKDGQIYEMKFSRGKITQSMKVVGRTDHTGTTVTFKPTRRCLTPWSITMRPCTPVCGRRHSSTPACASRPWTCGLARSKRTTCATRAAFGSLLPF